MVIVLSADVLSVNAACGVAAMMSAGGISSWSSGGNPVNGVSIVVTSHVPVSVSSKGN